MDASNWNEAQILLGTLMAQRAEHARELLAEVGLPTSGRKEELELRLAESLVTGRLERERLIAKLDKIEAWGRQHVFLYDPPDHVPIHLRSPQALQATLARAGIDITVNASASLALPATKTLKLVKLTGDLLRVEWVEARKWSERVPSHDYAEVIGGREIAFRAVHERTQRAISAFEWNFGARTAELFIHRLPSGSRYLQEEQAFRDLLRCIVDLDTFDVPRLKRALVKFKDAPGVREIKTNYIAANGAKVAIQSADRATPLGAEPELQDFRDAIKASRRFGPGFLNCFFEAGAALEREVHAHIIATEGRVGFIGSCSEAEVRHVLSRIRRASR